MYVDGLCLMHQLFGQRLHSTGTLLRGTCRGWRRCVKVRVEGGLCWWCEGVCGGVVVEGVAMGWGSVRGWERKERVDVEEKRGGMVGCVVLWWCVGEGLKEGRAWLCEW